VIFQDSGRKNLLSERRASLASQSPIAFNGLAKSGDHHTT
jgi:hypothetical protein